MAPPKHQGEQVIDVGWKYGEKVIEGNRHKIKCNFCNRIITGGITRFKEHLGGISGEVKPCDKVPDHIKKEMKALLMGKRVAKKMKSKKDIDIQDLDTDDSDINSEDKEFRRALKESRRQHEEDEEIRQTGRVRGEKSGTIGGAVDIDRGRKESEQKSIPGFWKKKLVRPVHRAIATFFYYNRIPANVASTKPYRDMLTAIQKGGEGIPGPSPYDIGGSLLDEAVSKIRGELSSHKIMWARYGCTIMCDGWTSIKRKELINFMVSSPAGVYFHKSIDASGIEKNARYLFTLMDEVVQEIGEEYVIQVVTDNASAYRAAGKDLMKKRKHLVWSPCAAHCIDLLLEDIGKNAIIRDTINTAKKITTFIYNHNRLIHIMKAHTENRELLRPGVTRFATQYIAMESLLKHRQALEAMFTSEDWRNYKLSKAKSGLPYEVPKIIKDDNFWERVNDIVKVMEPMVAVLRLVDTEMRPTMPYLFDAIQKAKNVMKRQNSRIFDFFKKEIDERWKKMRQDIHLAAFFLNPKYQYNDRIDKPAAAEKSTKEMINRYAPSYEMQMKAMQELNYFMTGVRSFSSPAARLAMHQVEPYDWWSSYGDDTPNLKYVAVRVLSQTCSSSGCERNWSTFSLIHTKIRNRLTHERLQKLVYVYYNLRISEMNEKRRRRLQTQEFDPIDINTFLADDDDDIGQWLNTKEGEKVDLEDDDELHERIDAELRQAGIDPQVARAEAATHMYEERFEISSESSIHHSSDSNGDDSPPPGFSGGGTGGHIGGSSGAYESIIPDSQFDYDTSRQHSGAGRTYDHTQPQSRYDSQYASQEGGTGPNTAGSYERTRDFRYAPSDQWQPPYAAYPQAMSAWSSPGRDYYFGRGGHQQYYGYESSISGGYSYQSTQDIHREPSQSDTSSSLADQIFASGLAGVSLYGAPPLHQRPEAYYSEEDDTKDSKDTEEPARNSFWW